MSGEVQPRKRKDKKKKKTEETRSDDAYLERTLSNDKDDDLPYRDDSEDKSSSDDHSHHGSNATALAKFVFLILLVSLLVAMGSIFFQLKGSQLADTPVKESRYASIFQNFVEEQATDEHDEHDAHLPQKDDLGKDDEKPRPEEHLEELDKKHEPTSESPAEERIVLEPSMPEKIEIPEPETIDEPEEEELEEHYDETREEDEIPDQGEEEPVLEEITRSTEEDENEEARIRETEENEPERDHKDFDSESPREAVEESKEEHPTEEIPHLVERESAPKSYFDEYQQTYEDREVDEDFRGGEIMDESKEDEKEAEQVRERPSLIGEMFDNLFEGVFNRVDGSHESDEEDKTEENESEENLPPGDDETPTFESNIEPQMEETPDVPREYIAEMEHEGYDEDAEHDEDRDVERDSERDEDRDAERDEDRDAERDEDRDAERDDDDVDDDRNDDSDSEESMDEIDEETHKEYIKIIDAVLREHHEHQKHESSGKDVYPSASITNDYDFEIKDEIDEANRVLSKAPDKAFTMFSSILENHPKSPRAMYGRAMAMDRLSDAHKSNSILEQSIFAYRDVLDLPNVPDELFKMSAYRCVDRMRFRGFQIKALKVLDRMLLRFPNDADVLNQKSVTYLLMGKNKNAKENLEETLKIHPNNGFAKVHYGFILKTEELDNKLAIKYLREGIDTREPGTIDGRFYFHLGDALVRENRSLEAYQVYEEGVRNGLFLSVFQRSLYNVRSLKAIPWWTPEQTTYQPYLKLLEENWLTIRNEAIPLISDEDQGYFPESEGLRRKGEWKQFEMFARGSKITQNCNRTPRTCNLIERIPNAADCKRGQVKFSLLQPGTRVWPHTGPTNCRLRAHLGLVVPKGAAIRVANETREWEEGRIMVFDDSFEHEVWHEGDGYRLILIVDFWHPELTEAQKQSLTPI